MNQDVLLRHIHTLTKYMRESKGEGREERSKGSRWKNHFRKHKEDRQRLNHDEPA